MQNFVIFITYLRKNPKITFSELYLIRTRGMHQATQKALPSKELMMNI